MSKREQESPRIQEQCSSEDIYQGLQNEQDRLFTTSPVNIPEEQIRYNKVHFPQDYTSVLYVAPHEQLTDTEEINAFMDSLLPSFHHTQKQQTHTSEINGMKFLVCGSIQYGSTLVRFTPTQEWAELLRQKQLSIQKTIQDRIATGEGDPGSIFYNPYLSGIIPLEK